MIRFALDQHQCLVHVDKVPTGRNCECSCTGCGELLVAKNAGPRKQHHFAHVGGTECTIALESLLHIRAKNCLRVGDVLAIEEQSDTFLRLDPDTWPPTPIFDTAKDVNVVFVPKEHVLIEDIRLEEHQGKFIPDIIVQGREKDSHRVVEWLIEVAVSHRVEAEKRGHLQHGGHRALEVYFGYEDQELSDASFRERILIPGDSRVILTHPRQSDALEEMRRGEEASLAVRRRYIDRCFEHSRSKHNARKKRFLDLPMRFRIYAGIITELTCPDTPDFSPRAVYSPHRGPGVVNLKSGVYAFDFVECEFGTLGAAVIRVNKGRVTGVRLGTVFHNSESIRAELVRRAAAKRRAK